MLVKLGFTKSIYAMYTSALFDHKQMGTGNKNKKGKRKNPFWVHSRAGEWGCGSAPMSRLEIVCLGREYTVKKRLQYT